VEIVLVRGVFHAQTVLVVDKTVVIVEAVGWLDMAITLQPVVCVAVPVV
jgi:hypothetical protein